MSLQNPFSPTFGASPPVLSGRDPILQDFDDALESGPKHPDYTMLVTGARGVGKTVLLNELRELARSRGWMAISDDATTKGMPQRLEAAVEELLGETSGRRRSITGIGVGPASVQIGEPGEKRPRSLRKLLSELGDHLAGHGAGLLITLDELQHSNIDEIRGFGAIIQHVTREEQRPVAFVGAGLTVIEDTILSGTAATFLQRCSRQEIGRLDDEAVRVAIAQPIEDQGSSITEEGLDTAVGATSGYPFMVQLVGFHSWKAATDPGRCITTEDVIVGVAAAEQRVGRLVLSPIWKDLSAMDRRFLLAMAEDDSASLLAEVASRLDRSVDYAYVYRRRLLKAGMITPAGRGRVDFTHAVGRTWVRDQPAETFM